MFYSKPRSFLKSFIFNINRDEFFFLCLTLLFNQFSFFHSYCIYFFFLSFFFSFFLFLYYLQLLLYFSLFISKQTYFLGKIMCFILACFSFKLLSSSSFSFCSPFLLLMFFFYFFLINLMKTATSYQ